MKKKIIRTISAIVLLAMVGTSLMSLTGCTPKPKVDSASDNTLEVYVYNAGYGYKWCEQMLEAFQNESWVKEKYPNLVVELTQDAARETAQTHLGSDTTKFDLIFAINGLPYAKPEHSANLYDTVFNTQVPGEDIKYADKMIPSVLNALTCSNQGKNEIYSTTWANVMTGIAYNETKLNALGFRVPNTTDELLAICESVNCGTIVDGAPLNGQKKVGDAIDTAVYDQKHAFITYGVSPYAQYSLSTWWAQYETEEEYFNFFRGYDGIGTSTDVMKQQGRLEALKVLEEIQKKTDGKERYTKLEPTASREAYRNAQSSVILGQSLFMFNGDWFHNEMADFIKGIGDKAGVIKMMKAPVISALADKTDISSDAVLSAVVSAVDQGYVTLDQATAAGVAGIDGVSAEDYETVCAARQVMFSLGVDHTVSIPKHSPAQGLAADFLRYMATDKCQEIYIQATQGASLPFKFDLAAKNPELYKSLSPMGKSAFDVLSDENLRILPCINAMPLVMKGGLMAFKSVGDKVGYAFHAQGKTAQQIFDDDYAYWTRDNYKNWEFAKKNAGM